MSKVYLVTEGTHEDYCVLSVFRTREKAEAWAAKYERTNPYGREVGIEEYELDPPEPEPRRYWYAWVNDDGEVVRTGTFEADALNTDDHRLQARIYELPKWVRYDGSSLKLGRAYGISDCGPDVALEAARDKLAEWKAKKADV